jgi:hypothetical protein
MEDLKHIRTLQCIPHRVNWVCFIPYCTGEWYHSQKSDYACKTSTAIMIYLFCRHGHGSVVDDCKSISTHTPDEAPGMRFFIRTAEIGLVALPDPRFRPDLGLHPSGEPRPSPAFQGAFGDSGRKKRAWKVEENSRAFPRVVWPRPVGESGRSSSSSSRLPRIVFPACIVFRAL